METEKTIHANYVELSDSTPMPIVNFWESRHNHITGWIDRVNETRIKKVG